MGLLPIQNQTTRQLSVNCVLNQWTWSVYLSVCWFKTARLLADILIRTLRLSKNGDFAQITQTPSDTYIKAEMYKMFHNWSVVLSYIETFSYNMADCCENKQLMVTAKVPG